MNALKLLHELKKRGVNLEADGVNLKVDAPIGALTKQNRAALVEAKPALLGFLSGRHREPADGGLRFDARPSRYPGYTSLYDPVEGRWHDFPTKDCYPSVVELAGGRRKGGAPEAGRIPRLDGAGRKPAGLRGGVAVHEDGGHEAPDGGRRRGGPRLAAGYIEHLEGPRDERSTEMGLEGTTRGEGGS